MTWIPDGYGPSSFLQSGAKSSSQSPEIAQTAPKNFPKNSRAYPVKEGVKAPRGPEEKSPAESSNIDNNQSVKSKVLVFLWVWSFNF